MCVSHTHTHTHRERERERETQLQVCKMQYVYCLAYRLDLFGIPGLAGGTLGDRLGTTIEFLPEGLRNRIKSGVAETAALGRLGSKAVRNTAGSVAKGFVGTDEAAGKLVGPRTHACGQGSCGCS